MRLDGYTPPLHCAVVNHSSLAKDEEISFWCEAVNKQIREHVAPAWQVPPMAVVFYGPSVKIPSDQAAVIGIVDDDNNSESAGYHTQLGDLVYGLVDMSQSSIPSRVLSHEALEIFTDAFLDRLVNGPDSLKYFTECADPCQADGYKVPVTLFGVSKDVTVSDFCLPAWYDLPSLETAVGPYNRLGTMTRPFEIAYGGYALAQDEKGRVLFLSHAKGAMMSAAKMNRTSRTSRIVRTA